MDDDLDLIIFLELGGYGNVEELVGLGNLAQGLWWRTMARLGGGTIIMILSRQRKVKYAP